MKTLIADDHHLVQKGLRIMLREVLGSNSEVDFASNGLEVLEMLNKTNYQMLITDLVMPKMDGMDMILSALKMQPSLKILIVTVNPDTIFAPRFLRAGVYGYVSKTASDSTLREAIWTVSNGRRYLSGTQAVEFADTFLYGNQANPFDKLSKREFDVALLILKGYGAIEVANTLSISNSTASSYRSRIFEKLSVKNLVEFIRIARQFRISDD